MQSPIIKDYSNTIYELVNQNLEYTVKNDNSHRYLDIEGIVRTILQSAELPWYFEFRTTVVF